MLPPSRTRRSSSFVTQRKLILSLKNNECNYRNLHKNYIMLFIKIIDYVERLSYNFYYMTAAFLGCRSSQIVQQLAVPS
uniref:Ovule protein n=1 Tax=Heterorhabditis bacteriophora TaxID=37862 RepID=A0A1I7WHX2_HETBA